MRNKTTFSPTDGSLSNGVAQLDTELKSNRGAGAAEADADDKESRENSFEEVVALKDDHFLDDQSAEDEDESGAGEEAADCQLHLLPEEIHHGGDRDACPHGNEADHDPEGGGKCFRDSLIEVGGGEVDHHRALPHLHKALKNYLVGGHVVIVTCDTA